MIIKHEITTLNDSTGTQLPADRSDRVQYNVSFSVQNISESASVYIGGNGVNSSSYGIKLAPGETASFDGLPRNSGIYALSSEGSSDVAVLQVVL